MMGIVIVIVVFCLSLWGMWSLYTNESRSTGNAEPPDIADFASPSETERKQPEQDHSSSAQP
jgi:hypothetical protein